LCFVSPPMLRKWYYGYLYCLPVNHCKLGPSSNGIVHIHLPDSLARDCTPQQLICLSFVLLQDYFATDFLVLETTERQLKKAMGRKKIQIARIDDERNRQVGHTVSCARDVACFFSGILSRSYGVLKLRYCRS